MKLLFSENCGLTPANQQEKFGAQVAESWNNFRTRLENQFGSDITSTTNNVGFQSINNLAAELNAGEYSHYVTSEGLYPEAFATLKQKCPNVTVLRMEDLDRKTFEDGSKLSLFNDNTKILPITRFDSIKHNLVGTVDESAQHIFRITRHPASGAQADALNQHFPNNKAVHLIAEQLPNVDAILARIAADRTKLAQEENEDRETSFIDTIKAVGSAFGVYHPAAEAVTVEVVLPPNMVAEIVEKKPEGMRIIRAQMDMSDRSNPKFIAYEEIEKVIIE